MGFTSLKFVIQIKSTQVFFGLVRARLNQEEKNQPKLFIRGLLKRVNIPKYEYIFGIIAFLISRILQMCDFDSPVSIELIESSNISITTIRSLYHNTVQILVPVA